MPFFVNSEEWDAKRVQAHNLGHNDSEIVATLANKYQWHEKFDRAFDSGHNATDIMDDLSERLKGDNPVGLPDPGHSQPGEYNPFEHRFDRREVNVPVDSNFDPGDMLTTDLRRTPRVWGNLTTKEQAEQESLIVPWVDPITVAVSAFSGGTYSALSAGVRPLTAILKGVIQTVPTAMLDVPIGAIVNEIENISPSWAFPANIALSIILGKKIGAPAERRIIGALSKHLGKEAREALVTLFTPIASKGLDTDFVRTKDLWLGQKDFSMLYTMAQSEQVKQRIAQEAGETNYGKVSELLDQAMQIFIDTERNPDHIRKFWSKLSPDQKRIVRLSQSLSKPQKILAKYVSDQYADIASKEIDEGVLKNSIDNYVARVWKGKKGIRRPGIKGFFTKTQHQKQRVYETILEGWANGDELNIKTATDSLAFRRQSGMNAIANKRFIRHLKTLDWENGKVISNNKLPGYERVEHPNFKDWRFVGQLKDQNVDELILDKFIRKGLSINTRGTIIREQEMFAPKEIAKNLNNILGVSALEGIPLIDSITRYNAELKSIRLASSFFHGFAFMRSFYLGGTPVRGLIQDVKAGKAFIPALMELTPIAAWKSGRKAVTEMEPMVELLVRKGMTLGRIQDWEDRLLRRESTAIGMILDKNKVTSYAKDTVLGLRDGWNRFIFQEVGMGLKTKTALIELKSMTKKHPEKSVEELAELVAQFANDDFGGLNLARFGRNPTIQHILRLVSLAPDWNESNIRTVVKATSLGLEGELYRRFWGRAIVKVMAANYLLNTILTANSEDDAITTFKDSWKKGKLHWLDADFTQVYKTFGGTEDVKKFFDGAGHFKDPIKYAAALMPRELWGVNLSPSELTVRERTKRVLNGKMSVIGRLISNGITGSDWMGREFTTASELINTGSTTRPKFTSGISSNVLESDILESTPSFILNSVQGSIPIPFEIMLKWWQGEIDGFDASFTAIGQRVKQEPYYTPARKRKSDELRQEIKRLNRKPIR